MVLCAPMIDNLVRALLNKFALQRLHSLTSIRSRPKSATTRRGTPGNSFRRLPPTGFLLAASDTRVTMFEVQSFGQKRVLFCQKVRFKRYSNKKKKEKKKERPYERKKNKMKEGKMK